MPLFTIVVALLISTQTGISSVTLSRLKEQVTSIYADANVGIRWVDSPQPGALTIAVVRDIAALPGCESAFGCSLLEVGTGTSRIAYVAHQAIWEYERPRPLLRDRLLSYVVAHELGHLIGLKHTHQRGLMFKNTEWLPHVQWTTREKTALATILRSATPTIMAFSPGISQAPEEGTVGRKTNR